MIDKDRSKTGTRFSTLSLHNAKLGYLYNERRQNLALDLRDFSHVLYATVLSIHHVGPEVENASASIARARGVVGFQRGLGGCLDKR
jgi:hypothetical protein